MVDRFWGEASEPPVWGCCDYCGGFIYMGGDYWTHEGLRVCEDCAQRYAFAVFEQQAARQTAVDGGWRP